MAQHKRNEFEEKDIELADFARAISHPARLEILKILSQRNTCICGEIVDVMPLSQATVSQHLKALKDAGLIQGEIDGPRSCYCLDAKGILKIKKLFENFFGKLEKCCEKPGRC